MNSAWRDASIAITVSTMVHLSVVFINPTPQPKPIPIPPIEFSVIQQPTSTPLTPEPKAPPADEPPQVTNAPTAQPKTAAAPANREPQTQAQKQPQSAGKTLTAEGKGADVADFSMVQGDSLSYAGGTTSSTGTGTSGDFGAPNTEKRGEPAAKSIEPAPVKPAIDSSRIATPLAASFDCSSLVPSSLAGEDATVRLIVTVSPAGKAQSVSVLSESRPGFADVATRCAMRQQYQPALDAFATPIQGLTKPFAIRFHQ